MLPVAVIQQSCDICMCARLRMTGGMTDWRVRVGKLISVLPS